MCVCVCVTGTSHEREYESLRMLEGLERMTAELLTSADQLKKGTSQSVSCCPNYLTSFSGQGSCAEVVACGITHL